MTINLDDPRISAYALGEMNKEESKEFETLLQNDPAAKAEVEAIQKLAGELTSELQQEQTAEMSEEARAKVVAASGGNVVAMPNRRPRRFAAGLLKVAALLVVAGGIAYVYVASPRNLNSSNGQPGRFQITQAPERGPVDGAKAESPAPSNGETNEEKGQQAVSAPPAPVVETVPDVTASVAEEADEQAVSAPPAPEPEPAAEPPAPAVESAPAASAPPAPAPAADRQAEPKEALKLELPKPRFVGSPKNIGTTAKPDHVLVPPTPAQPERMAITSAPPPPPSPPPVQARVMQYGTTLPPGTNEGVYLYDVPVSRRAPGTESYKAIVENEFKRVASEPLSTFSIDVDTASYANVRRFLNDGQLPPPDAVRIEELVNYFKYDYPEPDGGSPFSVTVEANACPWNRDHALALVGLRGRSVPMDERAPINLVFLIDVSGSMAPPDKLPLLKKAMRLLVDTLGEQDRVGIVTYASNTGVALPSTSGADKARILPVLEVLSAGGSTNGAGGIQLAYEMAARNFIRGGVNRIVLATDGDFNVGISDTDTLVRFIEDKAKSGVFLSVLGFGTGNLKDDKLEGLADKGNGHYAYIDSFAEARRVLLDDVAGTMMPIAKDVKIQIEFNPAQVGAYRLIGYENRVMAARDFNDDKKDAGEIGSGHTVTALYELVPPDGVAGLGGVDPLKYQQNPPEEQQAQPRRGEASNELMTVKLRYKRPDGNRSTKFEVPVLARDGGAATRNFKFASSVAMFGMLLRDSQYRGAASFDMALALAEQARGDDKTGQRTEFMSLVQTARALRGPMPVMAQAEPAGTAPGLPPGFRLPESAPGVPEGFEPASKGNRAVRDKKRGGGRPNESEELALELPKPMFVGTPKNIVSVNLDPNTGKKREPFMVPAGTRLLSQGAPVTASDMQPIIGEVEMITDGDKEGADGSFVEFGPGVQWVQIDLGEPREINAVVFWHYHSQARLYHDVIVRASNEPDCINYTELFNNDHDNSARLGVGRDYDYIETNEGKLVDDRGVKARYVRLYSNGNTSNDMNHMIEVEIFGR